MLAACSPSGGERAQDPELEEAAVSRSIEEVVAARTPELMRIEGVEGVGQALCEGQPCIRVYIRTAAVERHVPQRLDGYRVSTVVTGMIRP